jgi:UDP-GlcNAc:undecaprenyl-phosphate/decaprenyl-phosphate GlcNAc-1-phosphate transferase
MDFISKFINLKDHIQVWIFLFTWFISEILLFTAIRLANRWNLHDAPNEARKIHDCPTPTIGGLPIFIAFLLGIYFANEGWEQMRPVVLGAGVCMILGLIDDLKPISAVIKLIVLFAVTLFIYQHTGKGGDSVQLTLFPWTALNVIFSLIWIVGMMSAINSLDNMDGLAAGITAIACLFMFFIAWDHWQRWLSFMSVALCAGCLTFLKYNFFQPKAGIFLGDNGSYFIGFTLASMAMMGAWTSPRLDLATDERVLKAIIIPPILLGVPIFDIITATVLRLVNGEVKTVKEAIIYCGRDHTSHRLVALGFNRRQAVLILWGLGGLLGMVSLMIHRSSDPWIYFPLAGFTLSLLLAFAILLNKAVVYEHQKTPR